MNALVEIEGLRIRARHGVMPQERIVGNMFEVSVSLEYPAALRATVSDRVSDTLDYAHVVEIIQGVMTVDSDLIEHVAGRIYAALISEYPGITGGRISVSKLAPPVAAELKAARFVLVF